MKDSRAIVAACFTASAPGFSARRDQMLGQVWRRLETVPSFGGGAEADILRARAALERDDPERALDLVRSAMPACPPWVRSAAGLIGRYAAWQCGFDPGDPPARSADPAIVALHLCLSAHIAHEALNPARAHDLAAEALDMARPDAVRGLAATIIAQIRHDAGERDRAWSDRNLPPPAQDAGGLPEAILAAQRLRADSLDLQGRTDLAHLGLQALEQLGHRHDAPRLVAGALGEMLRLQLRSGRLQAASGLRRRITALARPEQKSGALGIALRLERARAETRFAVARGRAPARCVLIELGALQSALSRVGKHRAALGATIQLCMAEHATGLRSIARARMVEALRIIDQAGAYRCLLDELPWLGGVLEDLDSSRDPAVENCLFWIRRQHRPTVAPQAVATLTRREQEIVPFLARGCSNKQIGRALGIAPETVKTHLRSIFDKLSVRTRAEVAFGTGGGVTLQMQSIR